jgi:hypothetical protein
MLEAAPHISVSVVVMMLTVVGFLNMLRLVTAEITFTDNNGYSELSIQYIAYPVSKIIYQCNIFLRMPLYI